jgi:hypothetical protein
MTRQREIPSILYRHPNLVNMTFPILPGVQKIKVIGASRLNDAYGNVGGTAGNGAIDMFEVVSGETYKSPSVMARKLTLEDSNRNVTRMIFDPDDFATPAKPYSGMGAGTYLPTDDQMLFIRIQTWNLAGGGSWNAPGPIIAIPPYDFFSTKEPVFTVSGIAPNLNIGAFPAAIPDFMFPTVLNFLIPAYSTTVSIDNLAAVGGVQLFVAFHPGMPPTVIKGDANMYMTGGVPEFFIAAPNGNPWFTIRVAVVNSA